MKKYVKHRINNFELRLSETISKNPIKYYEIIMYNDNDTNVFTIGSWELKYKDMPSFSFCCDRWEYVNSNDWDSFKSLLDEGYKIYEELEGEESL